MQVKTWKKIHMIDEDKKIVKNTAFKQKMIFQNIRLIPKFI